MTRKSKLLAGSCVLLFGASTIAAFATNDTIAVTIGVAGKVANLISFVSGNVISETGVCDATTENRCATVSAAGAVKVDGSAVTQPVSGTVTATGTVAATQSGTWTVQPGNTANTTAWKVDGSAVTQPTSLASGAVTDLGRADDAACGSDTGTCSLIALTKRNNQNTTGPVGAGTNLIGKVGIDQTTPGTTNAVALVGVNGATALAGNGVTGTGSARVTISSDNSALPAAGQGATAATAPSGATQSGCRAASTDPTAVTDGQMAGVMCGLSGKQVMLPYAIKELAISGTATTTAATVTTLIASAGGSLKNYITGIQCWNSSAVAVIITLNNVETTGSGNQLLLPAGGGNNAKYDVAIATAAATAFTFQVTTGGAQSTIGCNAQGYTGL